MNDDIFSVVESMEDKEEILDQISKLPFSDGIRNKSLVISDMSIGELYDAIHTASFLNKEKEYVKTLVDEFVWKLGADECFFYKYFRETKETKEIKRKGREKYVSFTEISPVLRNEIISTFGNPPYFLEQIHCRFIKPILTKCVKNLRLLKYVCDTRQIDKRRNKLQLYYFISEGSLDCINYVFPKYLDVDSLTYSAIATRGDVEILKYFHSILNTSMKFEFNKIMLNITAAYGHLDCFKYMHEKGATCNIISWNNAASNGRLNVLKYLHENRVHEEEIPHFVCTGAAQNGHLDCLKYLHEIKCPWDVYTCSGAAAYGHLECLKYAHENGCPWDVYTCSSAAAYGKLECLKYAHENGCPWDERTCSSAAAYGKLECLKYAHENGYPWNKDTTRVAAQGGHLECLMYAHENGCPWDKNTYWWATRLNDEDMLSYLDENGCPKH